MCFAHVVCMYSIVFFWCIYHTSIHKRITQGPAIIFHKACHNVLCGRIYFLVLLPRKLSVFCRVVPESPRWLLIQGRGEEAREVLDRLARGNGTQLPAAELKKPLSTGGEKVSMLDLFRGRSIRQRTVVLVISW